MNVADALNAIIDDGIEEVRVAYAAPAKQLRRDGAMRGFEDCRAKQPGEIAALMAQCAEATWAAYRAQAPDYWFWRMRELQVEWVANVLSAILLVNDMPGLVTPTVRGVSKAAAILGVGLGADRA